MASTPSIALGLVLNDMERAKSGKATYRVVLRNMTMVEGRLSDVNDESVLMNDRHAGGNVEIQRRHIARIDKLVEDRQRAGLFTFGIVAVTVVAFSIYTIGLDLPLGEYGDRIMFGLGILAVTSAGWLKYTPARRWIVAWEPVYPPPDLLVVKDSYLDEDA